MEERAMEKLDTLFKLEVVEAKITCREQLAKIVQSAELDEINLGPKKMPLSKYIDRFIEGGMEGNRYASAGYRDETWLLNRCREIVSGRRKETGEEGSSGDKWREFSGYAEEYIARHGLSGYGMETRARVYSVILHTRFQEYAATEYCREIWLAELTRVGEGGRGETLKEYSGVGYLCMYLQGAMRGLMESMEYVDEGSGKSVNAILQE